MSALAAAATYAYPLSLGGYEKLLRTKEMRDASATRSIQLYGNWSAARRIAGVEPTTPRLSSSRSRWTDADILGFIRHYLRAAGNGGTFGGYVWRHRDVGADTPSVAFVRNRLGTWSDVKRKTLVS